MQPNQYTKNTTDLERFWNRVNKDGPVIREELGPCWVWTGNMMGRRYKIGGYGRIIVAGKRYPTHRFSWQLHNGPIPEGLQVLHRCDNPPCVRPGHLFLGTNTDNIRDAITKGLRNPDTSRYRYRARVTMTKERYRKLMNEGGRLTEAEVKDGWHFCHDWDGLLIHPSDPEARACLCRAVEVIQ